MMTFMPMTPNTPIVNPMSDEAAPVSPCCRESRMFVVCVCMGEASARSARDAGFATIEIRGDVTFPHLYNYMQETFVDFERLDAQLRAYIDTFAGFRPLLDACVRATKCSCALVDRQYRSIYQLIWEDGRCADNLPSMLESDAVDLFMASNRYRHMRSSRNVFTVPGSDDLLMKNVFADKKLVGMLVARHGGDVLSARYVRFVLRYLSPFVEEMFARLGSFEESALGAERVRIAINKTLAGDGSGAAELAAALGENGHGADARFLVMRIERSFTHDGPEERDYVARRFESEWPDAYCFSYRDSLYMLVDVGASDSDKSGPFMADMPAFARDNLAKVGMSRVFCSPDDLVASCRQAEAALSCGSAFDPTRWCHRFDEYALSWLVMRARGDEPARTFRHPGIGVLQDYDKGHGTDLLRTLSCFLGCRCNATAASSVLFVARSTLLNRLERIKELTGIDLEDSEELLYLGFSLKM